MDRVVLTGYFPGDFTLSIPNKDEKVKQLMERPLGGLRLCAVMLDGTAFKDRQMIAGPWYGLRWNENHGQRQKLSWRPKHVG